MKQERIAIISPYRSAMGKAGGVFRNLSASDLGAKILKEVVARSEIDPNLIDEVIIGNVAQPADSANISRVIALKAGLPEKIPAFTVHRNCASGMEAFTTAATKIRAGEAEIIAVGGVESMSNIPLLYGKKMTEFFEKLMKSKTFGQKFKTILSFRPKFLKPIIGIQQGLTDPISGLIMGCTAENVARDFKITRAEQDEFALKSHQKAQKATENGNFAAEIIPIYNGDPKNSQLIEKDEGIRFNQKIEDLQKLKPYFERNTGSVTVGNSSQITDGAAFAIVMSEKKAKQLKLKPMAYLTDFAYAGLDPSRMGLGPVFATNELLQKSDYKMEDFDLIELNEAFAAQVIGCVKAFESDEFAKEKLGRKKALGKIDEAKLNINGGAVALGHPVGMTGARLIVHLAHELQKHEKQTGLATLCIGGGQGGSCVIERK